MHCIAAINIVEVTFTNKWEIHYKMAVSILSPLLYYYSRTLNSIDLYLLLINSSKLLMAKPIPPCPKQKGPGYHKKPHVIA